jgi:hypothetical protein
MFGQITSEQSSPSNNNYKNPFLHKKKKKKKICFLHLHFLVLEHHDLSLAERFLFLEDRLLLLLVEHLK